jgi:hypothetical protein
LARFGGIERAVVCRSPPTLGFMKIARIDGSEIRDEASFHATFASALGFPAFYGCNMNAWIDCMSYIDDASAGMSSLTVLPGETLTIWIESAAEFKAQSPGMWLALLECAAFVNYRLGEQRSVPLLAIAAYA